MFAGLWSRMYVRFQLAIFCLTLFVVATPAQSQSPIFPSNKISPIPSYSGGAIGDFNNDGLVDFVAVGYADSTQKRTITTQLSQGDGISFVTVTSPLMTCPDNDPLLLAVAADMNNDHKLDLILYSCNGYFVVLPGNGDGTFSSPAFYALAGVTRFITSDLNKDGYPDVIAITATTTGAGAMSVLLNQGSSNPGALRNPVNYAVPSRLYAVAPQLGAGDFNGDGNQDIVAPIGVTLTTQSDPPPQMAVFYGNGDGTLQTPKITSAGGTAFVTADFNQDGITDLAFIFNDQHTEVPPLYYLIPSFRVLLGTRDGNFTDGGSLTLDPEESSYNSLVSDSLVFAGTRNNGKVIDLALGGSNTTILLGDGTGGFAFGTPYAISGLVTSVTDTGRTTDLIVSNGTNTRGRVRGNGDGTFQALPAFPVGSRGFTVADVNNDGLTDIVSTDYLGNLVTSLGRGNGTFSRLSATTKTSGPSNRLVLGDFDADGNADVLTIWPGHTWGHGASSAENALLSFYKGTGVGGFQPPTSTTGVDLKVTGASTAVVGDFNGDGKMDLVISYKNLDNADYLSGLVFLAGKGDGTFNTAVPFSPQTAYSESQVLVGKINNDSKLDLIWKNAVYLNNGDGTFNQTPLGITGTPLALNDLNGDGKVDLVTTGGVYAGNGDGTFQSSPFYIAQPSASSAIIGDLNADGHTDLMLDNTILFGDGTGNFVPDANSYSVGSPSFLARLNSQAVHLPNGNAPDLLTYSNLSAVSLLNQLNPAPAAAQPVPSRTQLTASANSVGANQQLTLTATVTGITPTGNVTFRSGSTTLGTSAITNGTATLTTQLTVAGSNNITANYAGDANNNASTSNAVSVKVLPPATTTVSGSPTNAIVGQTVTFTATVSGVNPTGTVLFRRSGPTGDRSPVLGQGTIANGITTLSTSFPQPGTYVIIAEYSGDDNNYGSFSSNSVIVTVTQSATTTALTVSSSNANSGQAITYTATVTGTNPTGSVTFNSIYPSAAILGTIPINNGVATFSTSFAIAGTYYVAATYFGDSSNLASASTSVPITVVAPDYTLTANPASATIKAGQTAMFTISMTSVGGYSGTVKLSCGSLPAEATCSFSPATLTGSGSSANSTLTTTTTAPKARLERPGSSSTRIAVWAVLLGLCLSPRRVLRSRRHLARIMTALLLTLGSLTYLAGCSSSSSLSTPKDAGTPAGTQIISVSAADSGSGPAHNLNLQLIVQ